MSTSMSLWLTFELVELIDVGRAVVAVDSDDQSEADGSFGGSDGNRENRDHYASRLLRLWAEAPEGNEI